MGGGSKWSKVKIALGLKLNTCLYEPRTTEDGPVVAPPLHPPPRPSARRFSDAESLSTTPSRNSDYGRVQMPTTPTPSSSGLLLPKHSSKSSKQTCAICLASMKPGHGHAIFTAECSHTFHFHCITSNVKHGKQSCPVCRVNWKEIPFQSPATNKSQGQVRINNVSWPQNDAWTTVTRLLHPPRVGINRQISSLFHTTEPDIFDDDELITGKTSTSNELDVGHSTGSVEVKTYAEVSAVPKSASHSNFTVLIHLKAPVTCGLQHSGICEGDLPLTAQTRRAPVDLVTLLDVSGSMAGTKLALLKRAMGFVIQNLGPSDRLSVIAFSSTARRLFPLFRMTDNGRLEALQAVNSLSASGGTNIAEGLRKAAKVMTERKWKNPFSSIILFSDGQDTYTVSRPINGNMCTGNPSLLPVSMHLNDASSLHIPVHAFGFGSDHDPVSMHSISETSGGTFSFIEAENVIQDAFAQCIGGLLSVVVQELHLDVECVNPMLHLSSIKSGSYKNSLASDKRKGIIEVGDLYAEEERDFLVTTDIPIDESNDEMSLLKIRCIYKDPVSKVLVTLNAANDVKIRRPVVTEPVAVSMEVDKQRNRLHSAEAIAEARVAAEHGDLASAVSVLESCRRKLLETVSAQAGDRLCVLLDAELQEMQERMANLHVYETSGRAYVLSGLSSHSWQRATARGDSTHSMSQAYLTPSMVDMVNQSQTMLFGNPSQSSTRPTRSFPAQPQPR
ncbi:Anaphase-promoting complex (APC), subunit 11 [Olea europaea subsp. europaea]|uniref:Anaphase-promoting complex (APC), subunit 11 n=1 Tax=Olea europaea subsp. europaea TaxID=158383 RepID=A0A8S0UBL1_OLEEU|nr:Anaphase-promoting complex (APC), subunit 11 [Olea europaea subsp. europaea]